MYLPEIFNNKTHYLNKIMETNIKTQHHYLLLTADDVLEIIENRQLLLQKYSRVELDINNTERLITRLSQSPYIDRDDYLTTILELQEIFYYLKNETRDQIADLEVIDFIMESFDNSSAGSIELLKGRDCESFIKEFQRQYYLQGGNINHG